MSETVLRKISPQENQSSEKSVKSEANPARTFPGGNTRTVTTLSAGLGFLEASLDPEMESGSKLDSDPETESGSVSLIAINFFLLVLLSLSFYRSTVLTQFSKRNNSPARGRPARARPGRTQPGDLLRHLPGDLLRHLPGDLLRHLPGDLLRHLPGDLLRHLPGDLLRSSLSHLGRPFLTTCPAPAGDLIRSFPGKLSCE
jgi:hypothetical protein